jgi:hypothetical protein
MTARRWYTDNCRLRPAGGTDAPGLTVGGQPVATPPNGEMARRSPADLQRISFLDEIGNPAPRDQARLAVIREFDDHGNVISMMTQRL